MSWYDDLYNGYDRYMWGGMLPGGSNSDDPARTGGEYAGIDRNNFNLPGYDQIQGRYDNYLKGIDSRSAPQITDTSAFAQQQQGLANLLSDRANGRGASVADLQMQRGLDQANAAQRQMMASASPSNSAMAMRLAGQNMGANDMDMTGQAAIARAAEANMAAGSLGSVLQGARGLDESRYAQNAQLQQNQYGIDDSARAGMLGGSLNAAQAQQQGGISYEGNRTSRYGSTLGVPTQGEQYMGMLTGLGKSLMGGA